MLLILGAAGAVAGINHLLCPVAAPAAAGAVRVSIEPGTTAGRISAILAEKGLIRHALIFQIYARRQGLEQKFMAGTYELSPGMSLPEIAAKIASGEADPETSWFTVPEGYTVEQIADSLAADALIDRAAFLEVAERPPAGILTQYPFLQEAAADARIRYVLEGYLFPDTYEIAAGSSEEAIIGMMLHRFDAVFDGSLQQRCAELEMTPHQILTLASIVEAETRAAAERKRIAGVFHNRLAQNWLLGSCATVQYILPDRKENLSIADTQTPSPYNTYLHPGLPPGPVGAPGEASIQAALYPEKTDYFYFVSKGDGSGEHHFSRSLSEHNRYKNMVEGK